MNSLKLRLDLLHSDTTLSLQSFVTMETSMLELVVVVVSGAHQTFGSINYYSCCPVITKFQSFSDEFRHSSQL